MGLFDKLGGLGDNTSITRKCSTLPFMFGYEIVESLDIVEYVIKNIAGDITKGYELIFKIA
jgi:hypothetical protein